MKRLAKKIAWMLVMAMIITLLPPDLGGMSKTVEASTGWTDAVVETLTSTSAGGNTEKILVDKRIYMVTSNLSYTGNAGKSPLKVAGGATTVIYVAKGCKLYVKGGNGSGQWTGGQPGITIPNGSTLIITGEGTVQAVGGNGTNGYNGSGAGGSRFNGKKANSMYFGNGGSGGAGGAGAGAGIGGAGGAGGNGGGGGAAATRTTDPGPFKWNGNNGGAGRAGYQGATMGNLYVLGTVALTATGGSRGSKGGSGGGDGWPADDAGSGFSNDYRTGKAGGGGGGGYGNAATAIGGGAGGGGGGGGGGTGGGAVNAGYPAGDGGAGGKNGGGRGAGYLSWSGGYRGAYGGAAGATGAAGGNGTLYKASTASVSGRTADYTANTHSLIKYDITIDDSAENVTGAQTTEMTYGASLVSQIPVPSRKGYTLGGLYSGVEGGGQKYFDADGNPELTLLKNDKYADNMGYWFITKNLPLYPKWIPNKYTLICNAEGGSGGGSYVVDYDATLPTVTIPSKVGYKFAGFYSDEGKPYVSDKGEWLLNIDGTTAGDGNVPSWKNKTELVTLHAKWVPIQYAIQLYSEGKYIDYEDDDTVGTVSREDGTVKGSGVKYGTFTLPSAEEIGLKKTHYNFLGWNIYDEQDWAMYKAGTVYRGGLTTSDEDVVPIYAAWEIMDNYSIIYNGNGGTKVPGAENAFDGDPYTIPNVTPQRTGYTFIGWSKDADCHPEDTDKIFEKGYTIEKIEEGMVLYAVWKENPAVSYSANGGIFSMNIEKKRYAKDDTVNVDFVNQPHRTGYTFKGWYTKDMSDDETVTEFRKGVTESFTMPEKDVTLSAIWKADDIDVYYDLDSDNYYTVEVTNEKGEALKTLWDPAKVGKAEASQNTTSDETEFDAKYSFAVKVPKNLDVTGFAVYINGAKQKNVQDESDTSCYRYVYTVNKVIGELDITIGGAEKIYYSLKYHLEGGSLKTEEDSGATPEETPEVEFDDYGNPIDPPVEHPESNATLVNEYVYGEGVELPASENLTHTGYTFGGWYLDSAHTNARTSILTTDRGNLDVYAKWNPITYTLVYNLNGGLDKSEATPFDKTISNVAYNHEIELPTGDTIQCPLLRNDDGEADPSSETYDFLGWSTNPNASEATYPGGFEVEGLTATQDASVTLYAIWATPESQLSLDANGGQFAITEDGVAKKPTMITKQTHITRVMSVSELEKPERVGYTFKGWSKTSDGTATYTDEHHLYITSASMSLYAVWEPATYKVIFDYNVADGETYKYKVYEGSTLKKDVGAAAFTDLLEQSLKYGKLDALNGNHYGVIRYDSVDTGKKYPTVMKFAGWASSKDALVPEYLDRQNVLNLWTPGMEDTEVTLYAVWTEGEVWYLNYDVNGGSWESDEKAAVAKPVSKAGGLIENVEVQAFDKAHNVAMPQKTGYSFAGWDTDLSKAADEVTYKKAELGSKTVAVSSIQSSEGMTLYAIWKPNTYKIVYSGDTATFADATGNGEVDGNEYDTVITLFGKADISKDGYTLKGWTKNSADCTVAEYQPGAQVKNLATGKAGDEGITLYPVWEANAKFKLTYDANGGSGEPEMQEFPVGADGSATGTMNAATEPTRAGYVFLGWSKDKNATAADSGYVDQAEVTLAGDLTLYAVWQAKTYTIEFVIGTTCNDSCLAEPPVDVGGTAPASQEVTSDDYITMPVDGTFTCDSHFVKGWTGNAGAFMPGAKYSVRSIIAGSEDASKITLTADWKSGSKPLYYLRYDVNGGNRGDDLMDSPGLEVDGVTVSTVSSVVPTRTGYDFVGWADSSTATEKDSAYDAGNSVTLTEDKTVYAVWEANSYTIQYDKNNANASFASDVEESASATYDVEKELLLSSRITCPGYTFKGWATSSTGDVVYNAGATVKNLATTGTVNLYAVWQKNDGFTVTYDTKGGNLIDAQSVSKIAAGDSDVSVTLAEAPVKTGYTFDGWKIEGFEKKDAGATVSISENVTAVAQWTANDYSINYVLDNSTVTGAAFADGKDTPQSATFDEEVNLYGDTDVKAAKYTLIGWSTVADGGVVYQPKQPVKNLATGESGKESITLYAVWKENAATYITYNANGGKFTLSPVATKFVQGQTENVTIQAKDSSSVALTPTKTGYDFGGWATDATATDATYTDGANVSASDFTSNTILYAVWNAKNYHIVYDANDTRASFANSTNNTTSRIEKTETIVETTDETTGETTETKTELVDEYKRNQVEATYNTEKILYSATDVILPKHKLKGWATEPQGDIVYQSGQKVKNLATGESSDDTIILYAVWESNGDWKIRYHANGGDDTPEPEIFLKEDNGTAKGQITSFEPSRDGYIFKGWAKTKNAATVDYLVGYDGSITLTEDLVLYAVWEEIITYGVSYDANGGAGKCPFDTKEYLSDEEVTIIFDQQPTKAGFQFLGWSTDKDSKTAEYSNSESGTKTFVIKADTKLYAVWKENTYSLEFYKGDSTIAENLLTGDSYAALKNIPFSKEIEMPTYEGEVPTGMKFAGWATADGGEAVYTPTDGKHNMLVTENEGSLNLYVAWEPVTVNVTINDGKAKVKLKEDSTTPQDGKVTFTQTYNDALANIDVASCDGYIFMGIYNGKTQIYDADGQPKGSSEFENDVVLTAKWEPVTYALHYEQLGNVISSETLTYDESVTIKKKENIKNLDVPSGYDLVGWSLLGMNNTSGTIYTPGDVLRNNELYKNGSDVTLYPIIQVDQTYAITYNANGGSKPPVDSTQYKFGERATIKTTVKPVKEGYTFAGWHDLTDPDVVYEADKTCDVQIKNNITLYAVWTPNEYKICYHNNYGDADVTITDTVNYDTDDYSFRSAEHLEETAEDSSDVVSLKRTGCTLLGWSTSKSGSVNYDPGSEMYQPLTRKQNQTVNLYAVWEKDPYTIIYAKNAPEDTEEEVEGIMLNQVMHYDDEQRLYNNRYTLTGYDFLGWADTSDAEAPQYSDEEIVKNLTDEKDAAITLYAVWSLKKLNVEFKVQGHGTAPEKQVVPYGGLAEKPADLSCEGYIFKGWYKDAEGTEEWNFADDKVTSDVTLYAKWSEVVATVKNEDGTITSFDSVEDAIDYAASKDEITTVTLKEDISVDSELTIPENVVLDIDTYKIFLEKFATIINYYIIKGTGTIEGDGTVNNNGTIKDISISVPTVENENGNLVDVTVDENTTVTGENNGSTDALYTVEFISKGEVVKTYIDVIPHSLIAEPAKPAVAGFAGWYSDEACTILWNFDLDKVNADTKLYAKYVESVEVSFDANGGEFIETVDPISVAVGSRLNESDLLAIAEKASYASMVFSGWYKDELCKEPWDFVIDTVTEDTVLYIGWGYPVAHEKEEVADISVTKVPAYTYTGKKITPAVSVSFGGKVLVPGTDYTVSYKNNVNAYTSVSGNNLIIDKDGRIDCSNVDTKNAPTIIIKGKNNYSNKTIALNFAIEPVSLGDNIETLGENVSADICDSYASNKKSTIKVSGTVAYNGKNLKSKDYTFTLVPVKAWDVVGKPLPEGELTKQQIPKGASGTFKLIVSGKGNYAGGFSKTITVKEGVKTLKKAKISVKKIAYTGNDLTVRDLLDTAKGKLTVKLGRKVLTYGTDYIVEFTGSDKVGSRTNGGIYPIVIKGKGDYLGSSRMANVTVTGINIKRAVVTLENASPVYTGSHIGANIKSVSVNGIAKGLTAGIDYDVVVKNDVKAGKASVTITGKGIYTGTKKVSYKIQKVKLTSAMFENVTISNNAIYLGKYDYRGGVAITPDVSISYNGINLINPADYSISLKNNKKANQTAKATINGKGNYKGSINAIFTIGDNKIDSSKLSIKKAAIKVYDQTYTGRNITISANEIKSAKITVKVGNKKASQDLVLGTDYEIISYVRNVNVGRAQLVIKGIGKYDGYKLVTFKITKKDLKWWQKKAH